MYRWPFICAEDNMIWHLNQCEAKISRESRPLYRLKKWLIGLRWVNNWLWRRGSKKLERKGAFVYRTRRFQNILQLHAFWRNREDGCTECMPDYPSIRELSNERPEEGVLIGILKRDAEMYSIKSSEGGFNA